MKKCVNCRKQIGEDMQFCPYCGTPITAIYEELSGQPSSGETVQPALVPKKNNMSRIVLIAVLVILLVGGGIVGTMLYLGSKNEIVPENISDNRKTEKNNPPKTKTGEVNQGKCDGKWYVADMF